ncbi:hypothetical protein ABEZ76_24195 [Priestia megaterium]
MDVIDDIKAIKNTFKNLKEGNTIPFPLIDDYYNRIIRKENNKFETFKPNYKHFDFNAVIGWEGQSFHYGYKEGFFNIAHGAIEEAKLFPDTLVYPIIYNYRQYLELVLKENIIRFEILFRLPISSSITHNLSKLLDRLIEILEPKNLGFLISSTQKKVIDDFMKIDQKNDAFRFVYDTKGNFNHEYKHTQINLLELHFTMNEVYNDFKAIDYLFEYGSFFDDDYLIPLNEGLIMALNNHFKGHTKVDLKKLKSLVSGFKYNFSDKVIFKLDNRSISKEDEYTYNVQSISGFSHILVIHIEHQEIKWIKVL